MTTETMTREELEREIALLRGARWLVSHLSKAGFVTMSTLEPAPFAQYLDTLPDGYEALKNDPLPAVLTDAAASKGLRDDLLAQGHALRLEYHGPLKKWWMVVRLNWRQRSRFLYGSWHEDELVAVALAYLEALTGRRVTLSVSGGRVRG